MDVSAKAIVAVMNTIWEAVKIRPEKKFLNFFSGLIFTITQVVLITAKIAFIFRSLSAVTCMIFIYLRSFIHNFRGWFGTNLVTSYCKDHGFKTLTGLNFSSGLIFTTVQLGFITARITFIFKYVSVLIFSSLVKIIT